MKKLQILIVVLLVLLIAWQASPVIGCEPPCCPPPCGPGTGTPGYWKNHPEAWPDGITIGGETYTEAEAITIMKTCRGGDKTCTMFKALVATTLNVMIGNRDCCIAGAMAEANAWMATYGPVGSGVKASSAAWQRGACPGGGECLYLRLDAYNNGYLCAPSRDALE